MALRCKDGDLAVIVGEMPGCESNIGRIVQVRGPAKLNHQCGLICWRIRTVTRKKLFILYPSGKLIAERVTWKSRTQHPDCWLIPIRPPAEDTNTSEPLKIEIKNLAEMVAVICN
jgi:hypothetical protein